MFEKVRYCKEIKNRLEAQSHPHIMKGEKKPSEANFGTSMHVPVPNIPLIIASQRLFQQAQAGLYRSGSSVGKKRPGRRILWAHTPHNVPKPNRFHRANPTIACVAKQFSFDSESRKFRNTHGR